MNEKILNQGYLCLYLEKEKKRAEKKADIRQIRRLKIRRKKGQF